MPPLMPVQREHAIGRLNAGESPQFIADAFNCNVRIIQRLQRRCNATNSTLDPPRSGHPQVTKQRQDRYILRHHLQDWFATAAQTARHTIGIHHKPVSDDTIRRRLAANKLARRRPVKGPIFTPRHRQERLQWTTDWRNWRHQQWRNIIFSDESRYCISTADGRKRVWRRRGEQFSDYCVVKRDSWVGPCIMVWVDIGLVRKLGPVVFQNIGAGRGNGVTAARYIDQVLQPHIVQHFARR
jgi:hypothetical protein